MNKENHERLTLNYRRKYESARSSVLIMIIFTIVNCAMLLFGSGSYFLFSAQFLYCSVVEAMFLTGKLPAEVYEGTEAFEFFSDGYLIATGIIVLAVLAIYFLCWIKSKNMHHKWLFAALVLFSIDAVANVVWFGFYVEDIIDYVFAAYIIYSIAAGLIARSKLAKLPAPIQAPENEFNNDFAFAERDFSYSDSGSDSSDSSDNSDNTDNK